MLGMQALFIFLSMCGGGYFLFAKRRFDYFSLAYFSAVVYFMPGFFGSAAYFMGGVWSDAPLNIETYWVMIFVMLTVWLSAVASEFVPQLIKLDMTVSAENSIPSILMFFTVIGFIGQLAAAGSVVLQPEKEVVMESLGRWHILFYSAATLGLPIAFHTRKHLLAWIFFGFLIFDLFLGFRSALAISIISTLTLLFFLRGRQRLILTNWKLLMLMLLFGGFMFGYKVVAYAVKAGLWDLVWEHLLDESAILFMITKSEPFLVLQTLNEVITTNFRTDARHIYLSLYQFLLFAPELGAENLTFNSLFQPTLFPEVEYGLAANIWAQMWSAGGWSLLVIFTIVFNLVLAVGNATLRARSMVLRAGFAPIFCYWGFYIHRNELTYALALEKRHLLLLALVIVVAAVAKAATRPVAGSVR